MESKVWWVNEGQGDSQEVEMCGGGCPGGLGPPPSLSVVYMPVSVWLHIQENDYVQLRLSAPYSLDLGLLIELGLGWWPASPIHLPAPSSQCWNHKHIEPIILFT